GGTDQGEVRSRVVLFLPLGHYLVALCYETGHAFAWLRPRGYAQYAETFVEPLYLSFRLSEMNIENVLQLCGSRGLAHFRQGLQQLLFGVQNVSQLLDQQLLYRPRFYKIGTLAMDGGGGFAGAVLSKRRLNFPDRLQRFEVHACKATNNLKMAKLLGSYIHQ